MIRLPRRRHSYRRRTQERAAGPLLLGLLVGMLITLGVALVATDVRPTVLVVNSAVVFASFLAMAAMGDRFFAFLWQRERMAKLANDRYEVQMGKIDAMGERLTQREQTIATLEDVVHDQKNAITNLNGTIATLRYQIDDLKGKRNAT